MTITEDTVAVPPPEVSAPPSPRPAPVPLQRPAPESLGLRFPPDYYVG